MPDSFLFSVVILSYRSNETWKKAVDSVLMQDYPKVELIFSDDGSPDFDKNIVLDYIVSNAKSNLCGFQILDSSVNRGTVKNLMEAERFCSGRYLIHFAADDALADEYALSLLAEALEGKSDDVLGVYGESIICDSDLTPTKDCSFDTTNAARMNAETSQQQWQRLCSRCCIHLGATAFVREELKKAEGFDDSFVLMEDWPFFLKCTHNGFRFTFVEQPVLLYRKGGITDGDFSEGRKQLFKDHLHLYEKYILPDSNRIGAKTCAVWLRYLDDRKDTDKAYGRLSNLSDKEIAGFTKKYPLYFCIWFLKRYRRYIALLVILILFLFIINLL